MKNPLVSLVFILALSSSSCRNNIPISNATTTPTIVPAKPPTLESTSTPTPAPTPITLIYTSPLGVSFAYLEGWFVSESEGIISIASNENVQLPQPGETLGLDEILMEILVAPLDFQTSSSLLDVLGSYTNFMGIDTPDKEPAHIIEVNGRKFAIGTYGRDYITTANHGNRAPLFIATHFTEVNTLLLDMYASPNNEAQMRQIFEDLLASIEVAP